jgi:hypothetical protein
MKIAIVGLSGIGSFFVRGLSESIRKDIKGYNRLEPLQIDVIDNDNIEEKNLAYTIFDVEHLGEQKAEVIAQLYGYKGVIKKIETVKDLEEYDFIILCVDNNKTRRLVYSSNIPFLDMRAKGRTLGVFLVGDYTGELAKQYLNLTEDTIDTEEQSTSCQFTRDLEEKNIQFGNRAVANMGLQVLKDYLTDGLLEKRVILAI